VKALEGDVSVPVDRTNASVDVPSWTVMPPTVTTTWKDRVMGMVIAPVVELKVPTPPPV
jgi:hypothetical protein